MQIIIQISLTSFHPTVLWTSNSQVSLLKNGPVLALAHVILVQDHYVWYFHDANDEYVEAVLYSLDGHEEKRKY